MKKRLLSALLALALVFVLLPTTALAGVAKGSDYDISINGTNYVFSDSETCYFKSSFTSTEPSSPYLKLTKSSDTITVTVSGYVTVSDISVHNNSSTQDKINLIIKGNKGSTLNIECKDTYGAALETYQSGDITIKGGITVNANFSANNTNRNTDCHGISASKNLIITGKGTTVNAVNTTTQESHNVTGHRDNHDGSHSNICGSCGYSAKVSHSYTWTPNANDNEKHIGTCVCGNVVERYHNFVGDVCSDCGYDKSTGTTCEHVWTTEWTIDTVDNEYHWHKCIKCNAITDKKPHAYTIVTDSGTNHIRECECKVFYVEDHISSDWIIDTPATATTAGSMHKECTVCKHKMQTEVIPATGEIVPPTPDNPGTIVIIRPAEEEKPAQQPNPSTGANDLVGLAVAAAVAAALGSAALLRKHD